MLAHCLGMLPGHESYQVGDRIRVAIALVDKLNDGYVVLLLVPAK